MTSTTLGVLIKCRGCVSLIRQCSCLPSWLCTNVNPSICPFLKQRYHYSCSIFRDQASYPLHSPSHRATLLCSSTYPLLPILGIGRPMIHSNNTPFVSLSRRRHFLSSYPSSSLYPFYDCIKVHPKSVLDPTAASLQWTMGTDS